MQKIKYTLLLLLGSTSILFSKNTTLRLTYEDFDFKNSAKKDNGTRVGMLLSHQSDDALYQFSYDKTHTDTYKPPLSEDVHVIKYYLKYSYNLDAKQSLAVRTVVHPTI